MIFLTLKKNSFFSTTKMEPTIEQKIQWLSQAVNSYARIERGFIRVSTVNELKVICVLMLGYNGERTLTAKDLVFETKLKKTIISKIIARFVSGGLLKVTPLPSDKRKKALYITEKGRKRIRAWAERQYSGFVVTVSDSSIKEASFILHIPGGS